MVYMMRILAYSVFHSVQKGSRKLYGTAPSIVCKVPSSSAAHIFGLRGVTFGSKSMTSERTELARADS
jgi:hypothetical protein